VYVCLRSTTIKEIDSKSNGDMESGKMHGTDFGGMRGSAIRGGGTLRGALVCVFTYLQHTCMLKEKTVAYTPPQPADLSYISLSSASSSVLPWRANTRKEFRFAGSYKPSPRVCLPGSFSPLPLPPPLTLLEDVYHTSPVNPAEGRLPCPRRLQ
jgi:hypothetical protein